MRPEAKKLLWDALEAAAKIQSFTGGHSFEDYVSDAMLRSAVERQLEIVGEACSRLARMDAETAARIPEIGRIISFRNVLAHDYAGVEDVLVWDVVANSLPALVALVQRLLEES